MNTKISYLYRDADNYKMHNKCVIAGTLTTEQTRTIKDCCEMGEYFIPRQVGLPERRFDRYDPCLLYTSPSPRDVEESRMPSSA